MGRDTIEAMDPNDRTDDTNDTADPPRDLSRDLSGDLPRDLFGDWTDDRRHRDARGRWLPDPRSLYGIELRYVLTDVIASAPQRVWTVADLVRVLERTGFEVVGRPSKVVSDHLRAEVNRGRVVRVGRGRYRMGVIPGGTRRRIRRVARFRSDLVRSGSLGG